MVKGLLMSVMGVGAVALRTPMRMRVYPGQDPGRVSRRRGLEYARDLLAAATCSLGGAHGIVTMQGPLRPLVASEGEPVAGRSLPELNAEYRAARRNWGPSSPEAAQAAALELVSLREAIYAAAELAMRQDWEKLAMQLETAPMDGRSVERIFDTLARASAVLDAEDVEEIGWNWGACGWRLGCGAAADVEEALAELRARNGLLLPREAIFCLDVALRGVDSAVAVCQSAELLPMPSETGSRAPHRSLQAVMSDRLDAETSRGDHEDEEDNWAAENPELARQLDEILSNEERMAEYLDLDSEVGNTIV